MKHLLLILLLFFVQITQSQTNTSKLEQQLEKIIASNKVAGFAVSVCSKDSVLFQKGYGLRDIEQQLPYTTKTLQNIASVSKTFIGVSLMIAEQQGLLQIDDPVNKYLPFPVYHPFHKKEAITLRQLATHTSTIRDLDKIYDVQAYHFGGDAPMPLGEFLEKYLRRGGEYFSTANFINKKPGLIYEYSNVGAALAAYVIEKAAQMPYSEFTKQYIFKPLEMTATNWFLKDIDRKKHSKLYESKNGLEALEPYGLVTYPDGGLRTNVEELTTFLQMVMRKGAYSNKQLISGTQVDKMLRPFPEAEKPKKISLNNQAIFWEYETYSIQKGVPLIGHTGGDPGVATFMMFDQQRGVGYIFFINTELTKSTASIFIGIAKELIEFGQEWAKNQK